MKVVPKETPGKQARPRDDLHKFKNGGESRDKRIFGIGTQEYTRKFGKECGKKTERMQKEERAKKDESK